ncbi:MAG: biotin--[acetyl-CoA-carboxylase] ligase [Pontiellaceae bacterium]|jgi:BirA family biotin operon repressor/biotin-[acetyl-CoA-carboxylase] ligase|nr:biotin--[acetyl-CoA-carboxylase] ligase [Pontiellaceae bacterium]
MKFFIQWYARLPSTNTFLKERVGIEPDLPSGTVAAAHEQVQGRGRHDREWVSACGENLTFSLLWRGDCEPRRLPAASMAVAVAVADLLETEGLSPTLKWPNDVLVNDRKICGILSEGVSGGIIIGIGLNVNMKRADSINQPATSLWIETRERRDINELLVKLLGNISVRLGEWEAGGFSKVRKSWEPKIPNIGKTVVVRDGAASRRGILAGFGGDGELLLREETGHLRTIWAGDISP